MTDDRPEVNLGDVATSQRIAAEAAHEERLQFLAFCQARAQRLVWTNAALIRRLAVELLRRPTLDGPAVEAVLTAARKEQDPMVALSESQA